MSGSLRRRAFAAALVLLLAGTWTANHAGGGRATLVVIEVQQPLSIFGRTYPGGRLTLRPLGSESSGVRLHAVALNGNILGVLPGRLRTRAGENTEATGFFGRDGKGRLHLLGYVSAERETYRF
ncbi:MAG TPA: hypothetical protein VFV75_01705 [Candidatus Polarisedimenticolaceae bacterium]|nr:hypothetical protein [Candidatus Polarisedimenticolaceae bacterium]